MDITTRFSPYETIAGQLLPHALEVTDDASHDVAHLLRVWRNVQTISEVEGGDGRTLIAATLLHDCVHIPKDSPQRSSASRLAAEKAQAVLAGCDWGTDVSDNVAHAIEAHSFSAGIAPRTLEARILQDADRLDAIGHIGIARCFYVSGRLGRALYDPDDPLGAARDLDDLTYAIDHFQTKLLRLLGSFQTPTGNALAAKRHKVVQEFMDGLLTEVAGA